MEKDEIIERVNKIYSYAQLIEPIMIERFELKILRGLISTLKKEIEANNE
jgi:hypothetical protein